MASTAMLVVPSPWKPRRSRNVGETTNPKLSSSGLRDWAIE
jgi:hypothetical protein